MKLSENQAKVIRLLQEGWELGCDTYSIGHTVIVTTCRLQKHGLGHGDPLERAKMVTIEALAKKGLIERILNPYPMVAPTRFILTKKGKGIT